MIRTINFLKYFSLIILTSLIFSSCSKDKDTPDDKNIQNNQPNNSSEQKVSDEVKYNPVIEKKDGSDSKMSQLKKDVFNKLLNNEPVKSSDITRLLIEEQVAYFNTDEKASSTTTAENIISNLNTLYSITNKISDIKEIKTSYETELYKNAMLYNAKATSLPYIFNKNRLQCYSSTMLHQLILRANPNFKNMNSVVIFEKGHVLSGFMSKEGDVWKLTGIENTAKGRALLDYGDITKYDVNDIRIVDSDLFAVFEIFKNDIANVNYVVKQILDMTAKKYGIDPKFNYEYDKLSSQYFSSTSFKSNETPLGFGTPDTDDEDKSIDYFDFKNYDTVSKEKGRVTDKVMEHGFSGFYYGPNGPIYY